MFLTLKFPEVTKRRYQESENYFANSSSSFFSSLSDFFYIVIYIATEECIK